MTRTYTYADPDGIPAQALPLIRGWANRRDYPVSWTVDRAATSSRIVRVTARLDAPSTGEHNRAVDSLARILDRAIRHDLTTNH